jgi:hypothetical protein
VKRSVAKASADWFRTIAGALGGAAPGAATKGFGSGALKVKGRIYASLTRGRLLLKLPAHRVDELVRLNIGDPFATGPGRVKKEWLTVYCWQRHLLRRHPACSVRRFFRYCSSVGLPSASWTKRSTSI